MKKLLLAVLALVLMLPVAVKADVIYLNSFYNDNASVNTEVVVYTTANFEFYPHEITYTYDPSMLSITKENVTTFGSSDTVEINNGKITIVVYENGPIEEYGIPYITLRFTALKAGTTEITPNLGKDYSSLPEKIKINISEASSEDKKTEVTEPTEKTEPVVTIGATEEKSESSCNDILLYVSLGANALLLIALIAVLLKGKKKEEAK